MQSINNIIKEGLFIENSQMTRIVGVNLCPISVLNCYLKVSENIINTQLIEKTKNLFSLHISLYIESCINAAKVEIKVGQQLIY